MSDTLDKLETSLHRAYRQIDILCHGFSVILKPSWDCLLNDVLKEVHEWEKCGKISRRIKLDPPVTFIYYPSQVTSATLPPIMFKQFKAKFLDIVQQYVMPAIKEFKQKNPDFDVDIFRPLLTIKVEGKD